MNLPQNRGIRLLLSVLLVFLVQSMNSRLLSRPSSAFPKADLLLLHGRVITMDQTRPRAQAIAIQGDRIAWVGSDEEARRIFPGAARVIDLRGASVLPGLIDAHVHLLELGKSLLRLNLKDVRDEAEAVERVKQRVASAAPNEWILGWGWDEGKWAAHYPTNQALNSVSPSNPVFLAGLHGFAAWANKQALQLAGVTKDTKDPENGKILRDEKTSEPTGVLLNQAQALVERHIPPMTLDQSKKAIELAAHECVRNGLTSVHDARVSAIMLQAFRDLIREGRLPLRVYAILDGADHELVAEWLKRGSEIDSQHRLTIRSFKLFADGALGSRGAALLEPYSDAPQSKGVITTPEKDVYELTRRSLERGTVEAAYAEFEEQSKGSIEKGKLADFTVVSQDITKLAPKEILSLHVLKTFVGGKPVYDADQDK